MLTFIIFIAATFLSIYFINKFIFLLINYFQLLAENESIMKELIEKNENKK